MAFIPATRSVMYFIWYVFVNGKIIRASGPSFCHVQRIKQLVHDIDAIVDGNQKWHGAAPSFNSSATNKSACINIWFLGLNRNTLA